MNINKPSGMTSHDVVAKIRRGLKPKKVGHAGTLDPMATGVLVICVGSATRLSEYAMASSKSYRATVCLGIETDTFDKEGKILAQRDTGDILCDDVVHVLSRFVGVIEQLPPMYSAIKQGGRKLYDLARAGIVVERQSRTVTIESIHIVDWRPPEVVLDVVCSAGTYIRSLAHDIGKALGVGAHLSALTRTVSGQFSLEDSVALDRVLIDAMWEQFLYPPDTVLADQPAVYLDDEGTDHILHGRPILGTNAQNETLARAYAANGEFFAVMKACDGWWRPHKVFVK